MTQINMVNLCQQQKKTLNALAEITDNEEDQKAVHNNNWQQNECLEYFPNTYLVHSIMKFRSKGCKKKDQPMPGVVIIMMAPIRDNRNESL